MKSLRDHFNLPTLAYVSDHAANKRTRVDAETGRSLFDLPRIRIVADHVAGKPFQFHGGLSLETDAIAAGRQRRHCVE